MALKPFESTIQDLVYNVDVGVGLKAIKVGLYLLMILTVMILYTATEFRGLRDAEAMDYAQLGRNLLFNKRLVTQCVRPVSMWYLIEHNRAPEHKRLVDGHPDILHAPLFPALLAAGYSLTGAPFQADPGGYPPEKWVVVPMGHVFTLLSGLLVFLMTTHLFDRRMAWWSTTIFFLSDMVWHDSVSGLGIPVATFLSLLAFYMTVLAGTRREEAFSLIRWLWPYVVSILAATLAFYMRYGLIILLPGILLYIFFSFGRRAWLWAAVFVACFLVGIAPWLVRNYLVSGGVLGLAPYTALSDSSLFMGDLFEKALAPSFKYGEAVRALQAKWITGIRKYYENDLRLLGDGFLVCFFVTTFFYRFVRQRVRLFRWAMLLSMVCLLILAGFFGDATMRLMHIFWPFVIMYGLAFFMILLDRLQFRIRLFNIALTLLLVLLTAVPLILSLLPPQIGIPYPPYFPPFINHVCDLLQPNELLCTDIPEATAWYGNRNSLLLPATIDEFYEINDYDKRVSGLYITTVTRDRSYVKDLLTGPYRSWFPILDGRIPADFPLTQGFPLKDMDQIFLTDRARWLE